ncbi:MAG: hypothetical protein EHM24_29180 [Acidobacteria bacterium]|nr:MAG: hypothetical protein EHM24_29180 [Acidobacteriota bacterium]
MTTTMKLGLGAVLAVVVALGSGWLWGSSGRWDAEAAVRDAHLRLRVADARGALASARVDLFELNYGQASRHLQVAKDALQDASQRLEADGRRPEAEAVRGALTKTVEAQQLAASVNTASNERAAEALRELDRASGASPAK